MIKTKDDSYLSYKTLSRIDYANALSFYHSNFDTEDARQFLKDYLSITPSRIETYQSYISSLDKIPDIWIPLSAAWISRLLALNCVLPEFGSQSFIISRIEEAMKKIPQQYIESEEKTSEKVKSLPPKKIELLTEIDGIIDDMIEGKITNFSFYKWLKEHETPSCHLHALVEKLKQELSEYGAILQDEDSDLTEGYSHLSTKKINSRVVLFRSLIEDAEKYIDGARQSRKPKKKKTVTVDMKMKFFVWMKEDISLKIVSVDPSKIIGSQELFVFDTKYKKLTHFVAVDGKGLDVYRTAIISYNEKLSHTYPLGLKKTEETLTALQNGGSAHKKKVLEGLKISPVFSERVHDYDILLAIY